MPSGRLNATASSTAVTSTARLVIAGAHAPMSPMKLMASTVTQATPRPATCHAISASAAMVIVGGVARMPCSSPFRSALIGRLIA